MKPIRVLIVDDSSLVRELIGAILSSDDEIAVVGEGKNGREAVEKVSQLKPDVVTMDIEMPIMNGLEAIEEIMANHAVPILVVTSKSDANLAYAAISKGALEVLSKSEVNPEDCQEFVNKVKLLSQVKVISHLRGNFPNRETRVWRRATEVEKYWFDKVVAIASSTGGPQALAVILANLPDNFSYPVFIAQHMSEGFIAGMATWLGGLTKLKIKVAENGERVSGGIVYLSPPERNMKLNRNNMVALIEREPKDIYRPSCDILLQSVASVYGLKSIGVILTGMGSDGVEGMKKIKEAGGVTIAQDERTSAVFGMPKVAIETGCIDKVLPLPEIGKEIIRLVGQK